MVSPGGVPAKMDPNGVYQVEQMYVQYFLQQKAKGKLPLLMWHGGGLTGVTYETKPDGQPGWLNYFLRAGWDVCCDSMVSNEELSAAVRNRWFAVVGISVGNSDRLDGVAALIRLVRRESSNRGIGVMVGGRVFAEKPELAGLVGADATATDGRQAALQAETLLALLARRN